MDNNSPFVDFDGQFDLPNHALGGDWGLAKHAPKTSAKKKNIREGGTVGGPRSIGRGNCGSDKCRVFLLGKHKTCFVKSKLNDHSSAEAAPQM